MSTPVVMPQMGESIAEGTIVRWIKKVGDRVDRDEPLFEISTDKVDAEIPSPLAGTVLEIKVKEGETVPVNSVVATIGEAQEAAGLQAAPAATPSEAKAEEVAATPPASGRAAPHTAQADGSPSTSARTESGASSGETSPKSSDDVGEGGREGSRASEAPAASAAGTDGNHRQKSSPLVRRIAQEHGVDIREIAGSGIGGRVTKHDILGYIENRGTPEPPHLGTQEPQNLGTQEPQNLGTQELRNQGTPGGDRIEPMSIMRKKIAEHMTLSRRTSAHVYSVFEVNYSRVDEIRRASRAEYEQRGVKLSFTSFIAKAAIDTLRRHPAINASIDGDKIVYRRAINLGIAVALDHGLIVPVVKRADELNLLGLSRAIADVADRARAKKLTPDEVHGGTFTITNPGNYGAQFGLPIINQPQVAILGVGAIEKRVVVVDDMIGIRLMGYLTLGYDHRLIDGAVADQFMADLKKSIEGFDAAGA